MGTQNSMIEVGREVDFTFQGEQMSGVIIIYPHSNGSEEYAEVKPGIGAAQGQDIIRRMQSDPWYAPLLLTIEASSIEFVSEPVNWAAGYEDNLPPMVTKSTPIYDRCEVCLSGSRYLIGIHCLACGHDQGDPIEQPAFALGAL